MNEVPKPVFQLLAAAVLYIAGSGIRTAWWRHLRSSRKWRLSLLLGTLLVPAFIQNCLLSPQNSIQPSPVVDDLADALSRLFLDLVGRYRKEKSSIVPFSLCLLTTSQAMGASLAEPVYIFSIQ